MTSALGDTWAACLHLTLLQIEKRLIFYIRDQELGFSHPVKPLMEIPLVSHPRLLAELILTSYSHPFFPNPVTLASPQLLSEAALFKTQRYWPLIANPVASVASVWSAPPQRATLTAVPVPRPSLSLGPVAVTVVR